MGAISGKPYSNGAYPTMAWGKVTGEPKSGSTKNGEPKISVSILVHSDKNDTDNSRNFMNVVFYGDCETTRTAARLEKGDTISVWGEYSSSQYTAKDGTQKTWTELRVAKGMGLMYSEDLMTRCAGVLASAVPTGNSRPAFSPAQGAVPVQFSSDEDDLPF